MKAIDTAVSLNDFAKRGYTVAIGSRGQAIDDPDVSFYEDFTCNSRGNVDGYCPQEWKPCSKSNPRRSIRTNEKD